MPGRRHFLKRILVPRNQEPNEFSSLVVKTTVVFLGVFIAGFSAILIFCLEEVEDGEWWAIVLLCVSGVGFGACVLVLILQPQNKTCLSFKVPLMPFLPILSMFVNIYLMLKLDTLTWLRFAVWMVIGLVIYFSYGMWHSAERTRVATNYDGLEEDTPGVGETRSIHSSAHETKDYASVN